MACLKQINRPLDQRNMVMLVDAFASFTPSSLDFDELIVRAAADEVTYMSVWMDWMKDAELPPPVAGVVDTIADLAAGKSRLESAIQRAVEYFEADEDNEDLREDLNA